MTAKGLDYFENKLGNEPELSEQDFKTFAIEKIKSISNDIWNKTNADTQSLDLYSGTIGIAFMFWHLSNQKTLFSDQECKQSLSRARTLITKALEQLKGKEKQTNESLLFGSCGQHLVAAIVFNSCEELEERDRYLDLFVNLCPIYVQLDFANPMRDTFSEGRAGFVSAALSANEVFNSHVVPIETLHNIGISVIKSGKSYFFA